MKIVLFIASFLFVASSQHDVFDASLLLNKNWEIDKTVEVFNGDTTIYQSNKKDRKTVFLNSLGGNVRFTTDSTGFYDWYPKESFSWKKIDQNHIKVSIDSLTERSENRHFFGLMEVLAQSDSTVVLKKRISRNDRWTRTFYLSYP